MQPASDLRAPNNEDSLEVSYYDHDTHQRQLGDNSHENQTLDNQTVKSSLTRKPLSTITEMPKENSTVTAGSNHAPSIVGRKFQQQAPTIFNQSAMESLILPEESFESRSLGNNASRDQYIDISQDIRR